MRHSGASWVKGWTCRDTAHAVEVIAQNQFAGFKSTLGKTKVEVPLIGKILKDVIFVLWI